MTYEVRQEMKINNGKCNMGRLQIVLAGKYTGTRTIL